MFPSVPWQRCQFHLQQNAGHHVARLDLRARVAGDIRAIFNAPNADEARRLLELFIARYTTSAPKLAEWAETAIPEGLVVFGFQEIKPEPIPLDIKVIIIGDDYLYYLLYNLERDFKEIFKTKAQFDTEMANFSSDFLNIVKRHFFK